MHRIHRTSDVDRLIRRHRGFAGWDCIWGDDPAVSGSPWVKVAVVRSPPPTGELLTIGGRSARVSSTGFTIFNPNPATTCRVDLTQRSLTETSGNERVELLEIEVFLGPGRPAEAACRPATGLAEAAAPMLPPS